MGILIVILVIVALIVGKLISAHNELVVRRNKVKNSRAHIDAQLQKRFELVPSLVEVLRSFLDHEAEVLKNVDSLENDYLEADTLVKKLAMDRKLDSELQHIYVIVNKYPDLKSNYQFVKLQESLKEIEEDITYARQFYNDAVTIYNNKLMSFPGNLIAAHFDFKEEELFEADKAAEFVPSVNLKQKCRICGASIVADRNSCPYCGTSY